jgi:hypothetical protein
MINTMSPPVLWPALLRLHRKLRVGRAARRERKHYQLEVERLPDRLLRDVGIYERPPRSFYRSPRVWF